MREVILYIAVSLDGYIADSLGKVDWIGGQDENATMEDTFTPFFKEIDTIIMGRKTYQQIITELSPDKWPYEGATTYVLTHHPDIDDTESIRFSNKDAGCLVETLKQQPGKGIWICGGAKIAQQLIANNLIDLYHLAFIPVLLGNGTRLFDTCHQKIKLEMTKFQKYNGIIEAVYRRRNDVVIRRMQHDDIERIMQIWITANLQAHDFIEEVYWKSQYENVKAMIPEAEIYVCEKSAQIVGFIGLSDHYIAGLFVSPESQCQGIGKRLLEYAQNIKPELYLSVYQKNKRAVRFYQKEGFIKESESVDENTGEKEFLMKRTKQSLSIPQF